MFAVTPIASKFYAPQRKTPSAKSGREQLQQFLQANSRCGCAAAKVDPFVRPVDSYRNLHYVTKRDSAYCGVSNRLKAGIMPKAKNLTLTKSQAACLIALRHGKDFKTKIAIEAGLDLVQTEGGLGALAGGGVRGTGGAKR